MSRRHRKKIKPVVVKPVAPVSITYPFVYCKHKLVKVGEYSIYPTGMMDNPPEVIGSLFLDGIRIPENMVMVSYKADLKGQGNVILVNIKDGGGLSGVSLKSIVNLALSWGKQGPIELGCMGGHGRTGMVLACIVAQELKLSAEDAIKWVRANHCTKAIETSSQIMGVYEFTGETYSGQVKPVGLWDSGLSEYSQTPLQCAGCGTITYRKSGMCFWCAEKQLKPQCDLCQKWDMKSVKDVGGVRMCDECEAAFKG